MPEAAGSSSVPRNAARHMAQRAGFPGTGSPPSRLTAFFSGRFPSLLAGLILALLLALPLAAQAGKQPASVSAVPHAPPFGLAEAAQVADPALRQELTTLSQEFHDTVTRKTAARFGHHTSRRLDLLLAPGREYLDAVRADAANQLRSAGADLSVSQFLVYTDRNPTTQMLFLAFYDAAAQTVRLLGTDFISSGKLRPGEDSFLTPVGVFENLPENWGYRAQGTKNSKGWRGLGARGSRVWDFGYQQAPRQFRQGVYDSQMRLLMHATDPDQGEPRLGGPDSKGCVRVSAAANAFLDRHSILDRHYERLAGTDTDRDLWLLRTDRSPTAHPGSYLVVGDSARHSAARGERRRRREAWVGRGLRRPKGFALWTPGKGPGWLMVRRLATHCQGKRWQHAQFDRSRRPPCDHRPPARALPVLSRCRASGVRRTRGRVPRGRRTRGRAGLENFMPPQPRCRPDLVGRRDPARPARPLSAPGPPARRRPAGHRRCHPCPVPDRPGRGAHGHDALRRAGDSPARPPASPRPRPLAHGRTYPPGQRGASDHAPAHLGGTHLPVHGPGHVVFAPVHHGLRSVPGAVRSVHDRLAGRAHPGPVAGKFLRLRADVRRPQRRRRPDLDPAPPDAPDRASAHPGPDRRRPAPGHLPQRGPGSGHGRLAGRPGHPARRLRRGRARTQARAGFPLRRGAGDRKPGRHDRRRALCPAPAHLSRAGHGQAFRHGARGRGRGAGLRHPVRRLLVATVRGPAGSGRPRPDSL